MKHTIFKKYSGIIALLLIGLMLSFSLTACSGDEDKEGESETESSAPQNEVEVTFFDGSDYTGSLVYPALDTGDEFVAARRTLTSALRQKLGSAPTTKKDSVDSADEARIEILLGKTDRPESAIPSGIGKNDGWYFVGVVDNKLVINAANPHFLAQAVQVFIDEYLVPTADGKLSLGSSKSTFYQSEDFCDDNWHLYSLPYYKGNEGLRFSSVAYNGGSLITAASTSEDTKQVLVSRTNADEFNAYINRLKDFGYVLHSERSIENNKYVTLRNSDSQIYAYFTAGRKTATIILEPLGITPEDFSYTVNADTNKGAEFYLYGLEMHPGGTVSAETDVYPNNGMLLVIKLADDSVIIVDGGNSSQMTGISGATVAPMVKFDEFLHEITNTPADQKVRIACWFLTHAHSDHYDAFYSFITQYSSGYTLERVCANIPDLSTVMTTSSSSIRNIGSVIRTQYPDCKEIKLHTGQSIQLADATLQVLYTHEDSVNSITGKLALDDENDSCTVIRVTAGEMSAMITGDMSKKTEEVIMGAFTKDTLSVDILQVAHHGFNNVDSLYSTVHAPIAIIPQSEGYMHYNKPGASAASTNKAKREILKALSEYATIYYSGEFEKTVGFAVRNGEVTVIYGTDLS